MTRIRMIVQYEGTAYVGWQVQANGLSVQQVMEEALKKLTGENIALFASGRTDSGVHARAQVAHFDTQSRIPPEKFCFALNVGLPRDIRVLYSDEAEGFHARYDVKRKHYRYTVLNAPHAEVFTRNTALHVHETLDFLAMRASAGALLGEHDFIAFKSAGTELENTVRTIYRSEWSREGNLLYYDVAGSGFMYNMVRIFAGTMLDIGMGRRDFGCIARALASGSRTDAGATAPAHGLTLRRIEYENFDTEEIVK